MASDNPPNCAGASRAVAYRLLLVRIVNFPQLWDAYGNSLRLALKRVVPERLDGLSLHRLAHAASGEYVFVHECPTETHALDEDLLCEQINVRLSFGPVVCDEEEAYLRIETAVIRRIENDPGGGLAPIGLTELPFA